MADFVHPATCEVIRSANEMPLPWVVCSREQTILWDAIPRPYRKWIVDHVEEMTPGEKAATDAAAIAAARDGVAARLNDAEDVLRALLLILLDELNAHVARANELNAAIVAASSLGGLRTVVGAMAPLPTRTASQLKTAIRNRLGA